MKQERKTPERTCVGCKTVKPKKEMIRIVRTKEGGIEIDKTGKKSGRGAYVCPDRHCLELAAKRDALSKALEVQVPREMMKQLSKEFEEYDE